MRPPSILPRPLSTALLLGAALAAPWALGQEAATGLSVAEDPPQPEWTQATPDHGQALVDPAMLHAAKGVAWSENTPQGEARCLLLEGDGSPVTFKVGAYAFSATRALVRVTTQADANGPIQRLSLYLENARDLSGNAVAAEAPRLLVTVSTTGKVQVVAPLLTKVETPPADDFTAAARARMLQADAPPAAAPATAANPAASTEAKAEDKAREERQTKRRAQHPTLQPAASAPATAPAAAPEPAIKEVLPSLPGLPGGDGKLGRLHASADRQDFLLANKKGGASQDADPEDTMLLMGHVRLSWEVDGRLVELRAENVVIFLDAAAKGSLDDASKVSGIYLEDNAVITSSIPDADFPNGQSTVRAPRIYFDVAHNRATLLDAVMYAVDTKTKIPLHLRAKLLRQHAKDSVEARRLTLSNNAFAEPDFAIGANRLTIRALPQTPGTTEKAQGRLTVSGLTPEIGGVPVAYVPYVALPSWRIPLRSIYAGYGTNDGATVRTKWGVHDVLGADKPKGEDLTADLDWRGQHGAGLGVERKYNFQDSFGNFRFYDLPADDGIDRIAGRDNLAHEEDHRYFLRFEHRHLLGEETELTVQAAHASDPTVQEMFFPAPTERPPETGLELKHAHQDWSITGVASLQTTDFTPSLTELEARGWQTERLEAAFRRIGTEVADGRANFYSENRVGRVRAAVGTDAPAARGISNVDALAEFGIPNTAPFRSMAGIQGVPTAWVNRFDTRQEIQVPLQSGPLDVTPFAVLRYTQWGSGIEQPGGAEDSKRLYGGGGVRLATELAGTSTDFKNAWLDVSGLRHVVRPELDLGWYGSSMNNGTLPLYDPDVEGLGEGGIARFGLINTWQTHRGQGANRHLVDWIRLKQDLVLRTDEDDPHRAIPRYVDWRPEYALGGSHTYHELLWQTTDALAMNGEATHSFDSDRIEQWAVGADYAHSDRLTSRLGYRETKMFDEQLVSYGIQYRLTPKYDLAVSQTFDLGPANTGWLNASLDRKTPGGILRFIGTYDELNGAYAVGIAFSPQGFGSGNGLSQSLFRRNPD